MESVGLGRKRSPRKNDSSRRRVWLQNHMIFASNVMNEGKARRDDLVRGKARFHWTDGQFWKDCRRFNRRFCFWMKLSSSSLRLDNQISSQEWSWTKAICHQSNCVIVNEIQIWYRRQVAIAN
jgi:hypothetical protein